MSNIKITEKMREIASDYDAVSQGLFDVANRMDEQRSYAVEDRLYSLVRIAESNTVNLRNLTARTMKHREAPRKESADTMLGISVVEEQKWIRITVPAILPHRSRRDKPDFLMRPLRNSLFQCQRKTPIESFGDCAICIVHGYDAELSTNRIRDYDNIETKRYLDVIESIFLTNDSGLVCSVLQTTELMRYDCTQFFLMQPETMSIWVKEHIRTKSNRGVNQ